MERQTGTLEPFLFVLSAISRAEWGWGTSPRRIDSRPCNLDPRAYQESANQVESCARNNIIHLAVFSAPAPAERVVDGFPYRHGDGANENEVTYLPQRSTVIEDNESMERHRLRPGLRPIPQRMGVPCAAVSVCFAVRTICLVDLEAFKVHRLGAADDRWNIRCGL